MSRSVTVRGVLGPKMLQMEIEVGEGPCVSICNSKMGNLVLVVTDRDVCSAALPFVSICNI